MHRRTEDRSYAILRLNDLRDESWAVIGRPSGAIALTPAGDLVMRLDKRMAERIANELNQRMTAQAEAQIGELQRA